jgi:hypothetical protein
MRVSNNVEWWRSGNLIDIQIILLQRFIWDDVKLSNKISVIWELLKCITTFDLRFLSKANYSLFRFPLKTNILPVLDFNRKKCLQVSFSSLKIITHCQYCHVNSACSNMLKHVQTRRHLKTSFDFVLPGKSHVELVRSKRKSQREENKSLSEVTNLRFLTFVLQISSKRRHG